jgi:hypothetical protein
MNLNAAIELQSVGRAPKMDARFEPVHAGAHMHFTKIGYMHTGNKNRGGIATSHYFKAKGGNSREIAVQPDGSYVKLSKTAGGTKRSRGNVDAKGAKCCGQGAPFGAKSVAAGGPGSGRHPGGGRAASAGVAYAAAHAAALAQLDRIREGLLKHKADAESANHGSGAGWEHVGDLNHYNSGLQDISDSLHHEGEYKL